jgi:CDP-paratose 2-epimerase
MKDKRLTGQNNKIGLLEWFQIGEYEHVEQVLADLKSLNVNYLRTGVSWADWHRPEAEGWYNWLFPRLAQEVELLPCFLYTPPSLGLVPKTSSPPREPKAYADFIDLMITRFGAYFDWVELWNEAANISEWDWTLDPDYYLFCEMVGGAAYWARHHGKKTVLAGMSPIDPNWLRLMIERGVVEHIDAIGIHGFPGVWEQTWEGWTNSIMKLRNLLQTHGLQAEIWITETGFSTWQHDEYSQLRAFTEAIQAPADRVYWYGVYDLDPKLPTIDGFHVDERDYHFGLKQLDGTPKLLFSTWAKGGLEAVYETLHLGAPLSLSKIGQKPAILITGGAGFVGTNLADRLLSAGERVILFDNLSRPGVEQNLRWLHEKHGAKLQIELADVRNHFALREAVRRSRQVFHLAAQVAVTTSLKDPIHDFKVNASGTLNLLEAIRSVPNPPSLVFTSTNKVYGGLDNISLVENKIRYQPMDYFINNWGVSEDIPLDFHSPYGCSKGTADQYVLDYARIFDLPTVVFRMSCIYGPHQFGTEDQGWVAHFLIQTLEDRPITIYGDGKQVRDILFVEDLVDAFLLAQENISTVAGQAFNIGGGRENSTSLLELLHLIGELHGQQPQFYFDEWRPGDQRYYISDIRKFQKMTGWKPRVKIAQGIKRLYQWLLESRRVPVLNLTTMEVVG